MALAGEAGSLLRIEEEIRSAITEAHALAIKQSAKRQKQLFDNAAPRGTEQRDLDFRGLNDEQFWQVAEQRIYEALAVYAAQADSGGRIERRLFADDAAQGFAFIDLCRRRYDVVLMNPPFGDASLPSKAYIDEAYGDTKGDVYKAFVECFNDRLSPCSYLGIISSRTGFFLGQSEDWRTRVVLRLFRPVLLVDLGLGVLDAMVEVAAYVLRSLTATEGNDLTLSLVHFLTQVDLDQQGRFSLPKWQAARGGLKRHQAVAELERLANRGFVERCRGDVVRYTRNLHECKKVSSQSSRGVYPPLMCIRALGETDKATLITNAVSHQSSRNTFVCDPGKFEEIPGAPFAYWARPTVRALFSQFSPFEAEGRCVRVGLQTSDDARFLRSWWEGPPIDGRTIWVPFAKGGSTQNFFSDIVSVLNWRNNGAELKAWAESLPGSTHWSRSIRSPDFYFKPGITWPLRASRFSPQAMPRGCVFSIRGQVAFVADGDLKYMLGLMASSVIDIVYKTMLGRFGFPEFAAGVLQKLPVPQIEMASKERLESLAAEAWRYKRTGYTASCASPHFVVPGILRTRGIGVTESAAAWALLVQAAEQGVARTQAAIDDLAFSLYGLDALDRDVLTVALARQATDHLDNVNDQGEDEETAGAEVTAFTADLLAYAFGSVFGRWDIRYATGEQPVPELSDPFAPLPICPPGMLQDENGLPLSPDAGRQLTADCQYPLDIAWDGILVDDPEHPLDVEKRVHDTLAVLWGDRVDAIQQEACALLGVPTLREWFRRPAGFFADHLKRYTKSRRKAPIYWPISTTSSSYTVWLYYHRFSKDTFFKVREIVGEKQGYEQRKLQRLKEQYGTQPTRSQAKEIETQEKVASEIKSMCEEIDRIAPLWNPNLNDGVIINFAPLWRLVPQHKAWQKECKECWDELVAGNYDWAHLAMHLWPERVVPKCVSDASLAIAHELEDTFWQRDDRDRLQPKPKPAGGWQPFIDELVQQRSSPAVKAALKSLLEAPVAGAGAKKGRGRRGATS